MLATLTLPRFVLVGALVATALRGTVLDLGALALALAAHAYESYVRAQREVSSRAATTADDARVRELETKVAAWESKTEALIASVRLGSGVTGPRR